LTTALPPLSLHDALPIFANGLAHVARLRARQLIGVIADQLRQAKQRAPAIARVHVPPRAAGEGAMRGLHRAAGVLRGVLRDGRRSEEHTSELQSPYDLVC